MTIQEKVLQLPKEEKIQMMEALWTDLSNHSFGLGDYFHRRGSRAGSDLNGTKLSDLTQKN